MVQVLRKYLKLRNEVFRISNIIDTGYALIQNTDSMGNKRIIKPSEYEIDNFIERCSNLKEVLIELISRYNSNNIIPAEYVDQINEFQINKLKDCRTLGELYLTIGKRIKSHVKIKSHVMYYILLEPLGPASGINYLEGLFITIIILLASFLISQMNIL